MALQSQLFRGDTKLEAAAVSDPAHIVPGAQGPHVGKIQAALIQLGAANLTPDLSYGSKTAAAVRAFKQKRGILNFEGKIDEIVGKKTIAALDAEMLASEKGAGSGGSKLGLNFNIPAGLANLLGLPPDQTLIKKTIDIIVKFQGTLGAETPLLPSQVFPLDSSRFENPDNPISTYKTKPNREIFRIGQRTIKIRSAAAGIIAIHVRQIKDTFKDKILGKIFIYGSSSGGRNALDLASALTSQGIPIEYVGILDAAFFPNECLNSPEPFTRDPKSFITDPVTIPRFTVPVITAAKKQNFFQKLGNHREFSQLQGRMLFTSSMGGKEVHGQIITFTENEDFTQQVKASFPAASGKFTFDDVCHINLTNVAQPVLQRRINAILDSL